MNQDNNPFRGVGGSYIKHQDGSVEQVEGPTADHPKGNCARDADGTPIVIVPPAATAEGQDQ